MTGVVFVQTCLLNNGFYQTAIEINTDTSIPIDAIDQPSFLHCSCAPIHVNMLVVKKHFKEL